MSSDFNSIISGGIIDDFGNNDQGGEPTPPPGETTFYITPQSGSLGRTMVVVLSGVNGTAWDVSSVLTFSGGDITVNALSISDASHAFANISIDVDAVLTARTMTMTTGSEVETRTNVFQIIAATFGGSYPPPRKKRIDGKEAPPAKKVKPPLTIRETMTLMLARQKRRERLRLRLRSKGRRVK